MKIEDEDRRSCLAPGTGTRAGGTWGRVALVFVALGSAVGPAAELRENAPEATALVRLTEDAIDESAGDLACYRIEAPAATYYLEKVGAGLSSMLDKDGIDWLSFHNRKGSGAGGEYRGFPNAVHQQAGSYFHPKNSGTDRSKTKVEFVGDNRVTISAVSDKGHWACRYDFLSTHCCFTMTKMPEGRKYWVLYEGTPGGQYDNTDWWMTSAVKRRTPLAQTHEGDIPAPEWIAFGDRRVNRVIVLVHHEDDDAPDRFCQMQKKMTVFGFGRKGIDKYIDKVPQRFSIGFVESTEHDEIARAVRERMRQGLFCRLEVSGTRMQSTGRMPVVPVSRFVAQPPPVP